MGQLTYRLNTFCHHLWGAGLILLLASRCAPTIGNVTGNQGPVDVPSTSLEGITWVLVSFATEKGPLPIPETLTATLRFVDGSYEFRAGCNDVFGEYELQNGVPKLVNIVMRLVDCTSDTNGVEAMALERALADSIESWSEYRMVDDELHISYERGELVFSRASSE